MRIWNIMFINNIRKAMTEKSKSLGSKQREEHFGGSSLCGI